MRFKTGLLIGFGIGYVLGAKAGRERYQQIAEAGRALKQNPGVQRLLGEVGATLQLGRDRVAEAASRQVERASSQLAEQASKAKARVATLGRRGGPGKEGPASGDGDAPPATRVT